MMAEVLGAEEYAICQVLKEDSRLHQPGDRFETKSADRLDLLIHLAKLRNSIRLEIQFRQTLAVFGARMRLMRRPQRAPDGRPNLMLLSGVGSIRNGIAGVILHGDLRDLVAAAAIVGI